MKVLSYLFIELFIDFSELFIYLFLVRAAKYLALLLTCLFIYSSYSTVHFFYWDFIQCHLIQIMQNFLVPKQLSIIYDTLTADEE